MHWQDRVRQALKRKDIEMALLEFSVQQQKKPENTAKETSASQERKQKRAKLKSEQDSSTQLTPSSSDAGSDTGHLSDDGELT